MPPLFVLTLKKTPSYAGGNGKLIVLHRETKIPTPIWYNIIKFDGLKY